MERGLLRSGITLGTKEIFNQTGSFIRSIILARLLSPQDFGIAATFALSFAFFEMVTNLAAETLLVQAKNGDDPGLQRTVHFLQVLRGIVISLGCVLAAESLSRLFGVPHAQWAFLTLALLPLLKGFAHTDPFRLQRNSNFNAFVIVHLSTTLVATIVAFPLAMWFRSYSAMVWILLVQAVAATSASHLVSKRPYRWTWNRACGRQIFAFGWPLLLNGILMFVIFQGDRVVIAASNRLFSSARYTHSDLATYSLAFSLTLMPTMLIANVCTSLFLPLLSRAQGLRQRFEHDYRACVRIVCSAAALASGPLILTGQWLVVQIYGLQYAPSTGVIGWLAAMQALRIMRVAPTLAALALGDTKNGLASNVVRTSAFGLVLAAASAGASLQWISAAGCAGELCALAYCVWNLERKHGVSRRVCLKPAAFLTAALCSAGMLQHFGIAEGHGAIQVVSSLAFVVLLASVVFAAFPRLRQDLRSLLA
jgi:O-antigen/teichoic acid export membrane protein